eukprot:PITA_06308
MGQKTRVEVQRDGAWTEAVVVVAYGRGRGRCYKVRYDHHPDSDAQRLTQEEDVPYTRVRPISPQAPHNYNYSLRDAVEVSDKGCWWPGIITQAMRTNSEFLFIYFPHNHIQKMYHYSKLRPAQEWLKDGKYRSIKATPSNDAKRFKDTESTESIDQILKYTETPVERCTGSAILGSPRTELDNKAQRNNPLNMVAEQRLETHDEELLAYHSVLEAFYAQSQVHLSWERHDFLTSLRLALHITTDERTDKLRRLISQS